MRGRRFRVKGCPGPADKNGDYVWVGNSFGGTLGRIDIRTKEVNLVPLPNPERRAAVGPAPRRTAC
jgi:streptogramin lyase